MRRRRDSVRPITVRPEDVVLIPIGSNQPDPIALDPVRPEGSTGVVLKPMGIRVTPDVEVSVTVSPDRQPLTKERQLSRKGFNE